MASFRRPSAPRNCASACRGITSTCWSTGQTSRRPPSAACSLASWTASPAPISRSCRRRCRVSPTRWRGQCEPIGSVQNEARMLENESSMVQNEASMLQNRASMVQNRASMVQNRASMVQNRASMLQNRASMVRNEASMVQNRAAMLQNRASMLQNEASMLRNEASGSSLLRSLDGWPLSLAPHPRPRRCLLLRKSAFICGSIWYDQSAGCWSWWIVAPRTTQRHPMAYSVS
jgi:adhesin HecA-like repeat protein